MMIQINNEIRNGSTVTLEIITKQEDQEYQSKIQQRELNI